MSKWIILLGGKRDGLEFNVEPGTEPRTYIHVPVAEVEEEAIDRLKCVASNRPQEMPEAFDLYQFKGKMRDDDPEARIYEYVGRYK